MIRSSSHARIPRPAEKGFVLVSVLVLAFLYFTLISLLLWESAETFRAAQRFRARVLALSLAESAAEMVVGKLATAPEAKIQEELPDGSVKAEGQTRGPDATGVTTFTIRADGRSKGTRPISAHVEVFGHLEGAVLRIDRTVHSQ